MSEPPSSPIQDSSLAVSLTVGQLRQLVREEIQAANGNASLEPLLDAEDVAKILGVDTGYIYSLARAKKIPSVKLGKYRKFCPYQLKRWLDRKNNTSGT